MLISRKRFARVLILFYKTYLSRLNLIVSSSLLDTSISSPSIDKSSSLASPSSSLIFNSTFKSLESFLDIVNSSNENIFSEAFANISEKKKKEKKRKDKKIANEDKKEEKKVNKKEKKNREFYRNWAIEIARINF